MVLALCLAVATVQSPVQAPRLMGAKAALRQIASTDPEAAILAKEQAFTASLHAYVALSPTMPRGKRP